jgi:hypothetical protein
MLSDPSILDSETDVTFMMSKSHKNNFASPIRSPESSGCSRTITLQLRIPTDQEKSHMGDPGASTLVSVTDVTFLKSISHKTTSFLPLDHLKQMACQNTITYHNNDILMPPEMDA